MPGMGPAPKPADQRARRNATIALTQLPAEGRSGPPPAWPLPPDLKLQAELENVAFDMAFIEAELDADPPEAERKKLQARHARLQKRHAVLKLMIEAAERDELELWADLWQTPQATQWERLRWHREVAMYARLTALGQAGDLDATKEARQFSDRLGLSPLALLRLRWEIAPVAEAAPKQRAKASKRYSNLRVVQTTSG